MLPQLPFALLVHALQYGLPVVVVVPVALPILMGRRRRRRRRLTFTIEGPPDPI